MHHIKPCKLYCPDRCWGMVVVFRFLFIVRIIIYYKLQLNYAFLVLSTENHDIIYIINDFISFIFSRFCLCLSKFYVHLNLIIYPILFFIYHFKSFVIFFLHILFFIVICWFPSSSLSPFSLHFFCTVLLRILEFWVAQSYKHELWGVGGPVLANFHIACGRCQGRPCWFTGLLLMMQSSVSSIFLPVFGWKIE